MLKIDLLPKHFAIARTNKRILTIGIILLVVVGAGFGLKHKDIRGEIAKTEEAIAEIKPTADDVRGLEGETSEKQGWLDPIKAKIDFVEQADKTGEEYFDRFHSINEYIWGQAQMSNFAFSGGSSVQFTVEVQGTAGVGRFLLNLLRCPDLTNITYSGVPGGRSITASGAGAVTTRGAPGVPGPGMMGPGGPMGLGMMGPGGPMGPGMMGPGGIPGGMPGPAGLTGAAGVEPGSPSEPISLQISATLTEPITTPTPPGAGAAAAGMGMGGPMMGPGMMGPGGMPMGRGMMRPPGGAMDPTMMGRGGTPAAPGATPESEAELDE